VCIVHPTSTHSWADSCSKSVPLISFQPFFPQGPLRPVCVPDYRSVGEFPINAPPPFCISSLVPPTGRKNAPLVLRAPFSTGRFAGAAVEFGDPSIQVLWLVCSPPAAPFLWGPRFSWLAGGRYWRDFTRKPENSPRLPVEPMGKTTQRKKREKPGVPFWMNAFVFTRLETQYFKKGIEPICCFPAVGFYSFVSAVVPACARFFTLNPHIFVPCKFVFFFPQFQEDHDPTTTLPKPIPPCAYGGPELSIY